MMRILLASGEEAVYRTVDELALGISSGTVTPTARFYDAPSQDWRSIDTHPEYHQALARAAMLVPVAALDPLPLKATAPGVDREAGGSHKIVQMFSVSAAELAAKRRPAWILPAFAGVAAIAMIASVLTVLRERSNPPAHAVVDSPAPPPSRVSSSAAKVPPNSSSMEAMRLAPVNLNTHQVFAMEAAGRRLGDTALALGLTGLLHPGKLTSPDSVRRTRARLLQLRELIEHYRASQRNAAVAYRDTAAMLTRTGFWSRVDQQEWKVFPSSMEPAVDAASADSVLSALERVYTLLSEPEASYRTANGRLAFRDSSRGAEYERLRTWLSQYVLDGDSAGERPHSALGVLRRAISSTSPATRP